MTPSAGSAATSSYATASAGSSSNNPLSAIESEAKRELSYLLSSYASPKVLVLDPGLKDPLDLLVGQAFLTAHGVVRTHLLGSGSVSVDSDDSESGSVVFVVRPRVCIMDDVAKVVRDVDGARKRRRGTNDSNPLNFHLVFVPNVTFLCEK